MENLKVVSALQNAITDKRKEVKKKALESNNVQLLSNMKTTLINGSNDERKISDIDFKTIFNILELHEQAEKIDILDFIQSLYSNYDMLDSSFRVSEEQRRYVVEVIDACINKIEQIMNEIKNSSFDDTDEIKNLISLKKKIDSTSEILLTSQELEFLIETLLKTGFSKKELTDIIIEVTISTLNQYKDLDINELESDLEIIDIEKPREVLDEEIVKQLFLQHGYNFDDLNIDDRMLLLECAELNNISEILELFNQNKIVIPLSQMSGKLTSIICFSTPFIVHRFIELAKTGSNLQHSFIQYLNTPSIFMKQRRTNPEEYKGGPFNPFNSDYVGAYENFFKNVEIFKELGIEDINSAYENCACAFTRSNKNIRKTIELFELYNIPKKVYLGTLSCFMSSNNFDAFDQFIELDCEDYILNYFGRTVLKPDDPVFFRLARARQLNMSDNQIFYGTKLRGEITTDQNGLGINNINGAIITNKSKEKFDSRYEAIISIKGSLTIPNLVFADQKIIKLEDEFKVDDYRYNIGGVTIARNKVLRIFETLVNNNIEADFNALRYSILKNSILTDEQVAAIDTALNKSLENKKYSGGGKTV